MTAAAHRSEHDLLGDREVPADAYWGVHTLRALENFPITGTPISALPAPRRRARRASRRPRPGPTRSSACSTRTRPPRSSRPAERSADGTLHEQFVVDVIQGGAGTSTNMNANEVIANRALELLGHAQGRLRATCTPTSTSISASSTNDVYPTAVKIATVFAVARTAGGDGRAAATPSPPRPTSSATS